MAVILSAALLEKNKFGSVTRPGDPSSVYVAKGGQRRCSHANSITARCPTNAAARCKLDSVMSRFGSRMWSTGDRLVFSKTAMRA